MTMLQCVRCNQTVGTVMNLDGESHCPLCAAVKLRAERDAALAAQKQAEAALKDRPLSYDELKVACAHFDIDLECGQCASIFFTGSGTSEHNNGCEGDSQYDKPIPEDEAIKAAHPMRTGKHAVYVRALEMVSAKHSKGALVEMVNWLLVERDAALRFEVTEEQRKALEECVRSAIYRGTYREAVDTLLAALRGPKPTGGA